MDKNAIKAKIAAQSSMLDSISIDLELVTEIDRHIKNMESQLNERFAHIPTSLVIKNFIPANRAATKIDEGIWKSLPFTKTWRNQKESSEELSFEKCSTGYSFFFKTGEVTFDLGLCEDAETIDWYYRIVEDGRKSVKVIGASVDIKLKVFEHLNQLLSDIGARADRIASQYRHGPAWGGSINRMSLNMAEAFSPAELAEIERNTYGPSR